MVVVVVVVVVEENTANLNRINNILRGPRMNFDADMSAAFLHLMKNYPTMCSIQTVRNTFVQRSITVLFIQRNILGDPCREGGGEGGGVH